jgi:hypothetical protein
MKSTEMVIDFASSLLNVNLREIGRNLKRLDLDDKSMTDLAKIIGNNP